MSNQRIERWQHLVTLAFHLDECPPEQAVVEARRVLRSVLEVFSAGIEPVDDFEAYAVRRLALSLLRALEASQCG